MDRILVVGGSLAGVNAIESLREHGHQGEITLVSGEHHLPYDRPPLSKEALKAGPVLDELLLKEAGWYSENGVELRLGVRATALDTADRTLTLSNGDQLTYDGLVIATGCVSRPLPALAAAPRVHVVRDFADAASLHAELQPGRHLVVVGAGFIGLEVAATARELGLDVSVVELAQVPLTRVLGDEAGGWFREFHTERGVNLYCGTTVTKVSPGAGCTTVELSDGTVLKADVVAAGVGVTPATDWLAGSGIHVDDGVLCDPALRTAAPDVVAAGDVVRWHNQLFGEQMRVEQWLNAVEQGEHAARTLLGDSQPFTHVPYFWSDQFDAMVRFVGRGAATDTIEVKRVNDRSLVALFGKDDVLEGALCINAPRALARSKVAIQNRIPWGDRADLV